MDKPHIKIKYHIASAEDYNYDFPSYKREIILFKVQLDKENWTWLDIRGISDRKYSRALGIYLRRLKYRKTLSYMHLLEVYPCLKAYVKN